LIGKHLLLEPHPSPNTPEIFNKRTFEKIYSTSTVTPSGLFFYAQATLLVSRHAFSTDDQNYDLE
jgi:hypothetical protein